MSRKTSRSDTAVSRHNRDLTTADHGASRFAFQKQLDYAFTWIENWNNEERIRFIEVVLKECSYEETQFLWTSLQPSLHRNYFYTAAAASLNLTPVSTFSSRNTKKDVQNENGIDFYRIPSVYITSHQDVRRLNGVNDRTDGNNKRAIKLPTLSQQAGDRLDVVKTEWFIRKSAPAILRHTESEKTGLHQRFEHLPVRRHIQSDPKAVEYSKSVKSKRNKSIPRNYSESPLLNSLSEDQKTLFQWFALEWEQLQRNDFLYQLVLRLETRQHYFIATFLSVFQHRNFIADLPEPITVKILSYLSPKQLLIASQVSKPWQKRCNHTDLWKEKCSEVSIDVPIINRDVDWKNFFKQTYFLRSNWMNGKCQIVECRGHSHNVLCVTFDNRHLATGSLDRTIKVWNLKNGKLLKTLTGHKKGVWCLRFLTTNLLISGSYDASIKVWNWVTGECCRNFCSHTGPVWALCIKDTILVSGSQDRTAKIWNPDQSTLLHTLEGHVGPVFCLDLDRDANLVITGSADKSIRLWGMVEGNCIRVIWASTKQSIMSVSYCQGLIACSYGSTISLWKLGPNQKADQILVLEEHEGRIECIQLIILDAENGHGFIVSGAQDGLVKYWSTNSTQSIQSYNIHSGRRVNCIAFDKVRIASASYDHTIKMLNFQL